MHHTLPTVGFNASVAVDWAAVTSDGQPAAVVPAFGVLTFAPGVTHRNISVEVLPDDLPEQDSVFYLTLAGTSNGVTVAESFRQVSVTVRPSCIVKLLSYNTIVDSPWRCGCTTWLCKYLDPHCCDVV